MDLLINIVTAWMAVVLMATLLIIYLLRLWITKSKLPKDAWQRKLNKSLRKPHKWLGVAALFAALIHGLYSSVAILTANKGTILFVIFILMGLSFVVRKRLDGVLPWMRIHRYLAVASLVFLLLHFLEVGWFVGIDPMIAAVQKDFASEDMSVKETPLESEAPATESEAIPGDGIRNEGSHGQGKNGNRNNNTEVTTKAADESANNLQDALKDGTYNGQAVGFRPGLKVAVTVENHLITEVVITEHNEVKQQFWGRPVAELPEAIIEAQSTEVDMVSGATLTSIGILDAVDHALQSARE